MVELTAMTERMRLVKDAHRQFLGLWAMQCLLESNGPRLMEALDTPEASETSYAMLERARLSND